MPHRPRRLAATCLGAVVAGILLAGSAMGVPYADPAGGAGDDASLVDSALEDASLGDASQLEPVPGVPWGAFLGSGPEGVEQMAGMQEWLGGSEMKVGHTYLPGNHWTDIEGDFGLLRSWASWRNARADRLFVLNVPMLDRNEAGVPDDQVSLALEQGARGRYDRVFRTLASRLVALGLRDAVIVLGWEMNGITYTSRCAPNPDAWKAYWRRIVASMRSIPGQRFRFDFAPSRGLDAIPWTECYPGDDVVDIIGMDTYDQPPGHSFDEQVNQPFGLRDQVEFARRHNKPISYPEWGLFRNGDNPEYMRRMLDWIAEHPPMYHTITDYCPHGVWRCGQNPRSSEVFRAQQFTHGGTVPRPAGCLMVDLGAWIELLTGKRRVCIRFSWGG
jgi:glycosyl hydrolase family 26